MMRRVLLATLLVMGACARHEAPRPTPDPSVHTIALPDLPFELPQAPGRDAATLCVTCHSLRYLMNQPRFSRRVWTEEVDKMIRTYGAPIPADQTATIVDYLVTVNGRED